MSLVRAPALATRNIIDGVLLHYTNGELRFRRRARIELALPSPRCDVQSGVAGCEKSQVLDICTSSVWSPHREPPPEHPAYQAGIPLIELYGHNIFNGA